MSRLDSLMNDQLHVQFLHVAPWDLMNDFRFILFSYLLCAPFCAFSCQCDTVNHKTEYTNSSPHNKRNSVPNFVAALPETARQRNSHHRARKLLEPLGCHHTTRTAYLNFRPCINRSRPPRLAATIKQPRQSLLP